METIGEIAAGGGAGDRQARPGQEDSGFLALLINTRQILQVVTIGEKKIQPKEHQLGTINSNIVFTSLFCFQENPDCLRGEGQRKIQENVSEIVKKGRVYAEKQMTRDERREKIQLVCEDLQKLISEKLQNISDEMTGLKSTVKELSEKIRKLQRLLRKTVVDQVSDLFINSLNPINSMLAYAQKGRKQVSFCCR